VKRLLLAGGGHAHVHVLQAAARQPFAGAAITLVSPFARQFYSGMLPGFVAGHYRAEQCAIPLPPLAAAARAEWVEGRIAALDAARRVATLADGREIGYDLLSLDTGGAQHRDLLHGAREYALFLRPVEHFVQLLERVLDRAAQRALDLAVVGGGAGGFEIVLALAHRLEALGTGSRVAWVTGPDGPLPGFVPAVRARAHAALERARVTVLPLACTALEAGELVLDGGTRVACDVPVLATGAQAPRWLAGSGLALDERGFVLTGPTLQSVSHPEVFAAGDVATRADAPHPKSGVHAVRAGPPLALNLRRALGGGELQPHRPQARTLYLLSTGRKHAIASRGGWSAAGRWVWWWKDRIDRGFIARYTLTAGES
jgi:pyridine nucleotide-disulfide oxidoreductase family protein